MPPTRYPCRRTKSAQPAGSLQYNRDVRPILAENCFACHGPDSAARKADLRLDQRDDAIEAEAIVPGKPDESELIERIYPRRREQMMPPPKTQEEADGRAEGDAQALDRGGAEYQPHWSFIAAEAADAAGGQERRRGSRNPIDRFILAELEKRGLKPAPEADRRTLARRLSLDLTGLPPTPAEVEAFVNDKSPDAYEKLVDRLLASPHWGEHRGRYWLDAARYADTHGIHFDNYREIWAYRDWVIDAFNQQHAVRPVHDRAARRRPAAEPHARPAGRHRLQPLQHHDERGRRDRRGVPRPLRPRPHRDDLAGLAGPDGRLRGLPRPQVRPDHAEGVLLAGGVLQQHDAERDGRQHQGHAADHLRCRSRRTAPRWDAIAKEVAELASQARRPQGGRAARLRQLARRPRRPTESLAKTPANGLQLHAPLNEGEGTNAPSRSTARPRRSRWATDSPGTPGRAAARRSKCSPAARLESADAGDFEKDQPFSRRRWVKLPNADVDRRGRRPHGRRRTTIAAGTCGSRAARSARTSSTSGRTTR